MWCGVVWWCAATLLVQWSTASIMHGRDCMHPQRRGTAMAETCARLARSLGVVNIVQHTSPSLLDAAGMALSGVGEPSGAELCAL